ncbi:CLUMA_CG013349, isoform A [Clunio marinus]|uniref:dolichyl-P-Man:Man5GlcNAc2-PP-dolichol alpha-1,3-mannosyltransferase n=1 Tax=Clunio marinus TaxID=568069 RepID=A0A1J1IIJ8_9DIPT|nr:CLUMA_CG013349, isoform A [Clunio marinus]
MAPPKVKQQKLLKSSEDKIFSKYFTIDFVKSLIFDPIRLPLVSILIMLAELALNIFIVIRIKYTEIDWNAYMQECEGFLNGTTDYSQLKGDTGPLVYPAGFIYIYSILYFITSRGKNILLAQYIFVLIYLIQLYLVLRLYSKTRKIPPYVIVLSVFTSYRIHSIYSLRLFNDPVAIILLYASLNLFMDRRWTLGSILFSLGVGVKMNILLFAPAMLMLYLTSLGYMKTLIQLIICGMVQLIIGAPFLLTYPYAYIKGSFDLGRVFEHKWTVNYRFLGIEIFEDFRFHLTLLILHLFLLAYVAKPCYIFFKNYARLRSLQAQFQPQIEAENREIENNLKKKMKRAKTKQSETESELTDEQKHFIESFEKGLKSRFGEAETKEEDEPKKIEIHFDQAVQLAILPIFLINFIGVICSRSLHYQFYVWYFHSLPYLSWFTDFPKSFKILILFLIEFCWNQYPSTIFSSLLLHACHLILLVGVVKKMRRETRLANEATSQKTE